jgi:multiple sugar transport system ATP-binding protein
VSFAAASGEFVVMLGPLICITIPTTGLSRGSSAAPGMNVIRGAVARLTDAGVTLVAEGLQGQMSVAVRQPGLKSGDPVTIGIRPEAFRDDPTGGWVLDGTIAVIESLGCETRLYLDGGPLRAFDSESHEGCFAVHRTRCALPF